MNWTKWIVAILQLVPQVVSGIQNLHSEKDTASKRQLAVDSLLLASGVASEVDPKDSDTISAVSSIAHSALDLHLNSQSQAATAGK